MEVALAVDRLTKEFPGKARPALDGVSFTVTAGRVCALLGANGAGKTTLVRILATLTAPTAGSAAVLGHDVGADGRAARRCLGVVGQYAAVDDVLTGSANLVVVARLHGLRRAAARHRADELLDRFGLAGAGDRPVSAYSGGMRRRLDLAAALVTDPRVLLVDEPTTGLDPVARRELWATLRTLVQLGTTVLLPTQHLEEADALADDVVLLRDGTVLLAGPAAEVRSLGGPPRTVLREPSLEDVYLRLHATHEEGAR